MQPIGPTVLTAHGYGLDRHAPENQALIEALREELTVSPLVNPNAPGYDASVPPPRIPLWRESPKRFYVPRAFGLARFGPAKRDLLATPEAGDPAPGLVFQGTLRAAQLEAVAAFEAAASDPRRRGGQIVVGCGAGKTVMAIHEACRLGRKTLIVAHKSFLMEQWRDRLAQYAPGASVGTIRQDRVDVGGRDVVIASLQSLAMRSYEPEVFRGFGLLIVDECHHVAAEVFSRALPRTTCAYALGLSATPDRKDGLSRVIEWFLGPACFVGQRRTDSTVEVRRLAFRQPQPQPPDEAGGDDGTYGVQHMIGWGPRARRNTARMLNDVASCASRNAFLVRALLDAMEAEPERRALVLSERRGHLLELEQRLREAGRGDIGFYVGGMKQTALDAAARSQILLATFQMAAEAMDVPGLTLLLATPLGDVNQSVGRVRRCAGKAVVLDVLDGFAPYLGMADRRARWYRSEHFNVLT